jgi:hypothetical protein
MNKPKKQSLVFKWVRKDSTIMLTSLPTRAGVQ